MCGEIFAKIVLSHQLLIIVTPVTLLRLEMSHK